MIRTMDITRYFGLIFFLLLSGVLAPGPAPAQASILGDLANNVYSFLGYETCEHPNVHNGAVRRLRSSLKKELFGQHLAVDMTVTSVKAHIEDPDPQKALVLSFHGWAGAGKTFTSKHLIESLYDKGVNSSFVRFFISSYHFPDPDRVAEYQRLIRRNIEDVIRNCERALFIFDEVDKTPPGVLDALVPYIQHPAKLLDRKHNYKKAIYIFLSNTGANDITRVAQLAWKDGKKREELTFMEFSEILSNEAFNTKSGGLYKSRMIDKVLVDLFIPFLPLERRHVISCVKVEAKRHGMDRSIIDEEAEKIADMLTYWPADLKLYSTTGCKKVDGFVKYRIAEMDLANYKENESVDDDDYEDVPHSKTDL